MSFISTYNANGNCKKVDPLELKGNCFGIIKACTYARTFIASRRMDDPNFRTLLYEATGCVLDDRDRKRLDRLDKLRWKSGNLVGTLLSSQREMYRAACEAISIYEQLRSEYPWLNEIKTKGVMLNGKYIEEMPAKLFLDSLQER